ncbi:MAG: pyruvate, phosphate dikinase, partial [Dehalococcoidia bacterium]|nr:pyruvate, phosphate dikinase [Dehalococcoidia bacterium]
MSQVVGFDDPLDEGADATSLLGGKGANLVEMRRGLGLPVPPGFIVTTEVCREYLAGGWPEGLDEQLRAHLERLGEETGRRLGDIESPLLVSVRSGAPVSMPGMMDTVLNVGATEAVRDSGAAEVGEPGFAADTWLRFCRLYSEVVLEVPKAEIDVAAASDGSAEGRLRAAERVRGLAENAGGIPSDPFEQVRASVAAVFRSWTSDRAVAFRAREGIADDLGTAVTVQAMVYGNLDEDSGTGVVFTRDPATGERVPYGDYLARAQGEDVVAGTHAVEGLAALQEHLPTAHDELLGVLDRLELHYRDMCDVEFTISQGRLYILQTRIGRRSPLAAVRMAVEMAEEPDFPLSRAEAVGRVDAATLQQLASLGRVREGAESLASGLAVSPGVGVGVLACDADRAADLNARGIDVVLAREETSPSDIHGMVGASGLVTTLGGVASHAAVVARSWSIPAVTSLEGAEVRAGGVQVGDVFVAEGETVTVDGSSGAFFEGDQREDASGESAEVRTLREWARELGVEPGTAIDHANEEGRDADVSLLELARAVQLKGLCTPERAAAALATAEQRIEELVNGNGGLFQETPRGMMLSADGREWVTEQLAAERDAADQAALNASYDRFMELNHRFKELVSNWQISSMDGHSDAEWAELVDGVASIDVDLGPVLTETETHVARLGSYAGRFERALEEMRAGDSSMLASPLKDSYHTVWFEYHEELITAGGTSAAG